MWYRICVEVAMFQPQDKKTLPLGRLLAHLVWSIIQGPGMIEITETLTYIYSKYG
jgi:hypothetical protein